MITTLHVAPTPLGDGVKQKQICTTEMPSFMQKRRTQTCVRLTDDGAPGGCIIGTQDLPEASVASKAQQGVVRGEQHGSRGVVAAVHAAGAAADEALDAVGRVAALQNAQVVHGRASESAVELDCDLRGRVELESGDTPAVFQRHSPTEHERQRYAQH